MARQQQQRSWTAYDDVLMYTCAVLSTIQERRWDDLADVTTHFPLQVEGERVLLEQPFRLLTWGAPGTGTYHRNDSTLIATGRIGVPLMFGHAVGRAVGNSHRKAAAAADAVPRWTPTDEGQLFVSTHGFYLHATNGLHRWGWESIDGAGIAGPALVQIQGQATTGPVNWQLSTHAAELIFILWALVRHHDHPQLVTESWLPAGWAAWAHHTVGKTPPAVDHTAPAVPEKRSRRRGSR